MAFVNPLIGADTTPQAQQPAVTPPPAFYSWANEQIKTMSGGAANSWDELDAAFDAIPAEPGREKKDTAAQLKKQLVDSYTSNVLPQYYQDPKLLAQAKAHAEAAMTPALMESAFKPLKAANAKAASQFDPNAETQESFNTLQAQREDAAKAAKAGIALDKLTRLHGQRFIKDLKLNDMDTDLANSIIETEQMKRKQLAADIEAKANQGLMDPAQAQQELDRLFREHQNLDGARNVLNDNNGFVESGAYLVGGVGKALIAVPELLGRLTSGSMSAINGKGFGTGWSDDDTFGAYMGELADGISKWQGEISRYDENAVAARYMMEAADAGGLDAGFAVLQSNPEIAWEMLATSGVDSITQFMVGGGIGKGVMMTANAAISHGKAAGRLMQAAPSLTAMKDVMVATTAAANMQRGVGAAKFVGAVTVPSIGEGNTAGRESQQYLREQFAAMPDDKFLGMPEIQAEKAVWMGMDDTRRAEYIAAKKEEHIGSIMAAQTAAITSGLIVTSTLGAKFGIERFLLGGAGNTAVGTKAMLGRAAGAGVVGAGIEASQEVFAVGTQHIFVNNALDRPLSADTPFDTFAGAAISGAIVGGPLDAGGSVLSTYRTNRKVAETDAANKQASAAAEAAAKAESDAEAAEGAAQDAEIDAAINEATSTRIAEENAEQAERDARPEGWTGGAFVDKNGSLKTGDAQKFSDAELQTDEVKTRIDAAFTVFNDPADEFSAANILSKAYELGLSAKQQGELEYTLRLATDPDEKNAVLQYRARVEVMAMTNLIRLSTLKTRQRATVAQALGARRQQQPPTSPNQVAGLLSGRVMSQELVPVGQPDPLMRPDVINAGFDNSDTKLLTSAYEVLGLPVSQAESFVESTSTELSDPNAYFDAEIVPDQLLLDSGVSPDQVPAQPSQLTGPDPMLSLPAPPTQQQQTRPAQMPPVYSDVSGDPLIAAMAGITRATPPAQRAAQDDAIRGALEQGAQAAQAQAQAEAQAQQEAQPTPMAPSRTALALDAGIPEGRVYTPLMSETNAAGTLGVQVVVYEDQSFGLILSGEMTGQSEGEVEMRVHTADIDSIVDGVMARADRDNPLSAVQIALTAAMNRVRQSGLGGNALIPAVRFAVSQAVMARITSGALVAADPIEQKSKVAAAMFLQRTIEEDRARIIDGKGRSALEYVTGVRLDLPARYGAFTDTLIDARVKWHQADSVLRGTGLYNQVEAAAQNAGVGKPTPKAKRDDMTPEQARVKDIQVNGALAAADAADAVANGGNITPTQAVQIATAIEADRPTVVGGSTAMIQQYESAPETLRWKELKTREADLIAQGLPVPERTAQEKADSEWTKQARKAITRQQIAESRQPTVDEMVSLRASLHSVAAVTLPKFVDSPETAAVLSERDALVNARYTKKQPPAAWQELPDQPEGVVGEFKAFAGNVVDVLTERIMRSDRDPDNLIDEDPNKFFNNPINKAAAVSVDRRVVDALPASQIKNFARLLGLPVTKDPATKLSRLLKFALERGALRRDYTSLKFAQFVFKAKADGEIIGVNDKAWVNAMVAEIGAFQKIKKSMTYVEKGDLIADAVALVRTAFSGKFPNRDTFSGSSYAVRKHELQKQLEVLLKGDMRSFGDRVEGERTALLQTLGAPDIESVPLSAAVVDTLVREVNADGVSRERIVAIKSIAQPLQFAITAQFNARGLNYKGVANAVDEMAVPSGAATTDALTTGNTTPLEDAVKEYLVENQGLTRGAWLRDTSNGVEVVKAAQSGSWTEAVRPYIDEGTWLLAKNVDAFVTDVIAIPTQINAFTTDSRSERSTALPGTAIPEKMPVLGDFRYSPELRAQAVNIATTIAHPDALDRSKDFVMPLTSGAVAQVMVHEFIHAGTVAALNLGAAMYDLVNNPASRVTAKTLTGVQLAVYNFYLDVRDAQNTVIAAMKARGIDPETVYGTASIKGTTTPNVREFVAELASPSFRRVLNTVKASGKRPMSVLSSIARAMAKLFGATEGSVLEQTTESITRMWNDIGSLDTDRTLSDPLALHVSKARADAGDNSFTSTFSRARDVIASLFRKSVTGGVDDMAVGGSTTPVQAPVMSLEDVVTVHTIDAKKAVRAASIFDEQNAADVVRAAQKGDWTEAVRPHVGEGTLLLAKAVNNFINKVISLPTPINTFTYDSRAERGDPRPGTPLPDRMPPLGNFRHSRSPRLQDINLATAAIDTATDIQFPLTSASVSQVMVHEFTHAGTVAAMNIGEDMATLVADPASGITAKTLTGVQLAAYNFYMDIKDAQDTTVAAMKARGIDPETVYGTASIRGTTTPNTKEFVAELASPSFRRVLNSVKASGKRSMSVLDAIARAMAKLFGATKGSVLEQTTEAVTRMWRDMERLDTDKTLMAPRSFHFERARADSVAKAKLAGLGSPEFNDFVSATLFTDPITAQTLDTLNDPMEDCQ